MSLVDGSLSGRQPKAAEARGCSSSSAGRRRVTKEIAEHLSMPSATTYRLLICSSPTAMLFGFPTFRASRWDRG